MQRVGFSGTLSPETDLIGVLSSLQDFFLDQVESLSETRGSRALGIKRPCRWRSIGRTFPR
jgi:hypothetical protein